MDADFIGESRIIAFQWKGAADRRLVMQNCYAGAENGNEGLYMISLDSPIWKELDSAGSDTDEILRDLMEGKEDFRENMESLSWDLSHQVCYYDATAYVLPHLAVLCTKLSLEDKAFLITEIDLAIAAEGVWPLKPDTEAFREFQEGLRGLRRETEKLVTNPNIAAVLRNNPTQRVLCPFCACNLWKPDACIWDVACA